MSRNSLFDAAADDSRQSALSVSELTAAIKAILEEALPSVTVWGEISTIGRPQSGHLYLTLKDQHAQISATVWRSVASRLRFDLEDGIEVICRGRVEVYPPRGNYQLIVEQIEPRGIGALELKFRQLKERLAKEGLFDEEHKRSLPPFPRRVAVVTSPSGAAIRDFLQVLGRRWKGASVLIVPVRVQGEGAADEIAAAIDQVNRFPTPVDCLVVTRGGGSIEDLWAFNEETAVRAVYRSNVPVVSAIGHEIDVTLCDFAADVRALTPSEAAERIAPAAEELAARLGQMQRRLVGTVRSRAAAARARLETLARQPVFRRPFQRIHDLARRLDELEGRARRAQKTLVETARQRCVGAAARLESLSPLAVLGRGYSITERTANGEVVRRAEHLSIGETLRTRFSAGSAISRVEQIEDGTGESVPACRD